MVAGRFPEAAGRVTPSATESRFRPWTCPRVSPRRRPSADARGGDRPRTVDRRHGLTPPLRMISTACCADRPADPTPIHKRRQERRHRRHAPLRRLVVAHPSGDRMQPGDHCENRQASEARLNSLSEIGYGVVCETLRVHQTCPLARTKNGPIEAFAPIGPRWGGYRRWFHIAHRSGRRFTCRRSDAAARAPGRGGPGRCRRRRRRSRRPWRGR